MDPLLGTGLFILAAVVWIVCAIYAYRLAPGYGRGAWPWAILAIIFGPLALIALVLLPKRLGQVRPRPAARGPARRAVREASQALI